jgi:hypothetical protein
LKNPSLFSLFPVNIVWIGAGEAPRQRLFL